MAIANEEKRTIRHDDCKNRPITGRRRASRRESRIDARYPVRDSRDASEIKAGAAPPRDPSFESRGERPFSLRPVHRRAHVSVSVNVRSERNVFRYRS